jgi:ABC-type molybdate transport system substrate-binding protein
LPQLAVERTPDGLNVLSAYGIGARAGSAAGARFVAFVLGAQSRRILHAYGFDQRSPLSV